MRTLVEYIRESLLDDFDLDDNIELNNQLFTYIRDITDSDTYNNAITYLKDNSKLLNSNDREDWRRVMHNHDICYMILTCKSDYKSPPSIAIGEIGPSKCTILYFDDKEKTIGSMPLNAGITRFCFEDSAFENEPCYVITNKKLASGFKKLKF